MIGGPRIRWLAPGRLPGCVLLTLMVVGIALAGLVLPLDPLRLDLAQAWQPPQLGSLCGRDGLGRDVLARLLVGTATTLKITLAALAIALALGVVVGVVADRLGGVGETLILRGVDLLMGVRELALTIVVVALLGPSPVAMITILGVGWTPPLIRLVRALAATQRASAHVLAATALGASPLRTVVTHILPNILGPIGVRAAAMVGPLAQAEATLSFLGIGVQDPWPSLGTLVRDGLSGLQSGSHLIIGATAMVFVVALTFTLVADELCRRFDPRSHAA